MRELVLTGQHVQLSPFDGRGQYRTDAGAQYKIIILINNNFRIKWLDACVYDRIIIVLSIITSYRTEAGTQYKIIIILIIINIFHFILHWFKEIPQKKHGHIKRVY